MGYKTEFNWVLKLKKSQGLDEISLIVGEVYDFSKSEYRTYPVELPINLINENWEVIASVEIVKLVLENNITSGKYKVIKIYSDEEREILTKQAKENSVILKEKGAVS